MAGISAKAPPDSPLHLLLVEDEPDEQLLFSLAVRKAQLNCRMHTVGNGQEAVDYLKGTGHYTDRTLHPLPDLIVLDLKMPVMDGCELLSWLKASPEFGHLPLVALSGSPETALKGRAYALGAGRYFEKPFGLTQWVAMVREICAFVHRRAFPLSASGDADTRAAA